MNFGEALELLKKGERISRTSWNGKGQWVSITHGKTLDLNVHDIWTDNVKDVAKANGGKVTLRPYMILKTAQEDIQIGWVPSTSDCLAEDWELIRLI